MPNRIELTGQIFGKLKVLSPAPSRNGKTYWLCECECGRQKEIRTTSLRNHSTNSCGQCSSSYSRNPNISLYSKIKICPICAKEFSTNINNRIYCYECSPEHDSSKFRKRAVKHQLILYKGGKCEKCGYNKCEGALQFHHIDMSQKEFQLSDTDITKKISLDDLKKEIDKCLLLCANCHAEIHYNN